MPILENKPLTVSIQASFDGQKMAAGQKRILNERSLLFDFVAEDAMVVLLFGRGHHVAGQNVHVVQLRFAIAYPFDQFAYAEQQLLALLVLRLHVVTQRDQSHLDAVPSIVDLIDFLGKMNGVLFVFQRSQVGLAFLVDQGVYLDLRNEVVLEQLEFAQPNLFGIGVLGEFVNF